MSLSSLIRRTLSATFIPRQVHSSQTGTRIGICRQICTTSTLKNQPEEEPVEEVAGSKKKAIVQIPVETSIQYLQSKAYNITYGNNPVWKNYRRNHKGGIPPSKTRKTCIRSGVIATGNPCPLCRDEYLVLSPKNVDLLKQFISPHTGEILSYSVTGVCQKKFQQLKIAISIAKDRGLITYDVPFREYDYSDYK
ncbi:28S ribosomal protein S18b, mitochondrial [Cimex lectularius]|uniref:Small ribosomal subunit protein mS40 n=1 Tax=Cimex lectularius TaxID=79782 RepID=A0A8I6RQ70_CIMLE|nr:28S ribosomal protein S18b, mitochondrial [Cimex lectularius]